MSAVFDFDDYCDEHAPLDLLMQLRAANPLFRCTLFAIPARCSNSLLERTPEWCELAVHGWEHGDPPTDGGECHAWDYEQMDWLIEFILHAKRVFGVRWSLGFKAPGWKISDGCYQALLDDGWWVADQRLEDARRPRGISVYLHEDDPVNRWHGHTHAVCGNGISETFPELLQKVKRAESFQFASEAVVTW